MRNDPLVTKIVMSLFDTGNLVDDIPLVTSQTLLQNGVRFVGNLPVPSWRPLNQLPTVTKGVPTPWQEQLYIVSSQFQMEKRFLRDKNAIQDPMEIQFNGWMENWAYTWNNIFFNNAHDDGTLTGTADLNAPVGLKARLANGTLYGTASDMVVKGVNNGTDIDLSTVSASTANDLIDGVNQLLINMNSEDGNGCVLYMNEQLYIKFLRAIRSLGAGGGWSMDQDNFGRTLQMYRGARIRKAGRKSPSGTPPTQTTQILGFENSDGTNNASGSYGSVFGCHFGPQYFAGWQDCELKPQNLGVDPTNGTMVNGLIDWGVGLWQVHTRAIGRLQQIKLK